MTNIETRNCAQDERSGAKNYSKSKDDNNRNIWQPSIRTPEYRTVAPTTKWGGVKYAADKLKNYHHLTMHVSAHVLASKQNDSDKDNNLRHTVPSRVYAGG
jgi:hypothetical protein